MPSRRVDPSHFSPDTVAFIEALSRHQVRYLVAGGEAVIYHGHARLTGDVDFFYDRDEPNVGRLYAALRDFWGGPPPGISGEQELAHRGLVLQYGVPPNRIDLINDIDGVGFDEASANRIEATICREAGGVPVSYLGLKELIRNKEACGGPKDLDDLAYLRRSAG
jgi:hypothetical protein